MSNSGLSQSGSLSPVSSTNTSTHLRSSNSSVEQSRPPEEEEKKIGSPTEIPSSAIFLSSTGKGKQRERGRVLLRLFSLVFGPPAGALIFVLGILLVGTFLLVVLYPFEAGLGFVGFFVLVWLTYCAVGIVLFNALNKPSNWAKFFWQEEAHLLFQQNYTTVYSFISSTQVAGDIEVYNLPSDPPIISYSYHARSYQLEWNVSEKFPKFKVPKSPDSPDSSALSSQFPLEVHLLHLPKGHLRDLFSAEYGGIWFLFHRRNSACFLRLSTRKKITRSYYVHGWWDAVTNLTEEANKWADPIQTLPTDVILFILSKVINAETLAENNEWRDNVAELGRLCLVSKAWRSAAMRDTLWENVYFSRAGTHLDYEIRARDAALKQLGYSSGDEYTVEEASLQDFHKLKDTVREQDNSRLLTYN